MAEITEFEDENTPRTCIVTKPRLPERHYRHSVAVDRPVRKPLEVREDGSKDRGLNTCEICGKLCEPGDSACPRCRDRINAVKSIEFFRETAVRNNMVLGRHAGIDWD